VKQLFKEHSQEGDRVLAEHGAWISWFKGSAVVAFTERLGKRLKVEGGDVNNWSERSKRSGKL